MYGRNASILNLIEEIHDLWKPVYPYLAQHISEVYGRKDGSVLEIGPFSGAIFELQRKGIGHFFTIATFPSGVGKYFLRVARDEDLGDQINVLETDPSLNGIGNKKVDLAIFRGAFFFPSLFKVDLQRIDEVLKPDGRAFIGGGFGKFTPAKVIRAIGKQSRDLNLKIGKIDIREEDLRQELCRVRIKATVEVSTDGGFWVILRR